MRKTQMICEKIRPSAGSEEEGEGEGGEWSRPEKFSILYQIFHENRQKQMKIWGDSRGSIRMSILS